MDPRPTVSEDRNGRLQRDDAQVLPTRLTEAEEFSDALDQLGREPTERRDFDPDAWRNKRSFGSVDQAWDDHEKRVDQARAAADERAEFDRKQQERVQRERLRLAGTLSADEQAGVYRVAQRKEAVEAVDKIRARAMEYLQSNPANAAQVQQYLAALEERVAPHRQQLARELAATEYFAHSKRLERGRLELAQIDPELGTPEGRQRLVKWLGKKGIAESRALQNMDPTDIGVSWKAMLAEEDQEHEEYVAAEIERRSIERNLNPLHRRTDRQSAFAALRNGGAGDLREYLAMRRDEQELRGSRRR